MDILTLKTDINNSIYPIYQSVTIKILKRNVILFLKTVDSRWHPVNGNIK